ETPKITFSIVVPYRNEVGNLPNLLKSFRNLNYLSDLFEIILVNDASEDASEKICRDFKKKCKNLNIICCNSVRKSISPKKDAIATAIEIARHKYILTTDADCTVPKNWLIQLDSYIQATSAALIAGPVAISLENEKNKFLKHFQELDFLSLQMATMGGFGLKNPFLCNGANLCYEKQSFLKVNGFEGNENIASGDDIFLLEKFRKAGLKCGFLRSHQAFVHTAPQAHLKALASQHVRWAAKTSAYKNVFGKSVGLLVLAMNLGLVITFFLMVFGFFPGKILFFFFVLKFNIDLLLLFTGLDFFGREKLLKHYFWSSFVYPFFSSYVALASLFLGYRWKGRFFGK
ncbi:MAG TPA: glycosyltransferase, partial [Salinimicrobium sp.]|nr:glycosyltransferase [Salinimicrobium sp.]